MKVTEFGKGFVVFLALVGVCVPAPAFAAAPAAPAIADIALQNGGVLHGQVVDLQNQPRANVPVVVVSGKQQLATGTTNKDGWFAFRGLRSGVYQLAVPEGSATYRVWAPETSPPAAQQAALLVTGDGVVRGQCCGGLGGFLTHPWVIAGIIATAIAVPVAIHNADKDDHPQTQN